MKPKSLTALLQACENFEKLAEWDLSKIVNTYKPQLANEVAAGIRSINHLVTTNKDAAQSEAITSLDEFFGRIGVSVNNMNPADTRGLDICIKDILSAVGSASFYYSSYNAGVGFDPITRLGGNDSPGAHMNNIYNLAKKVEGYVKYNAVIAAK